MKHKLDIRSINNGCFERQNNLLMTSTSTSHQFNGTHVMSSTTSNLNQCNNGCQAFDYGSSVWVGDPKAKANILLTQCPNINENENYEPSATSFGITKAKFNNKLTVLLFLIIAFIQILFYIQ